jgi:hypothetical protein
VWAPRHDHQVTGRQKSGSGIGGIRMTAAMHCPSFLIPDSCFSDLRRLGRGSRVLLLRAREAEQAYRAISTGRLHALPRFHSRPINVVVYHGSQGKSGLEGGFPLRCLQRLSRPHLATRLCRWRDNRSTRGASTPVLSYWGQRLSNFQHPRQIGTELSHDVLNPAHVPL